MVGVGGGGSKDKGSYLHEILLWPRDMPTLCQMVLSAVKKKKYLPDVGRLRQGRVETHRK